jgi:transposase-like protein
VIYLFSISKNGVSAMELQRQFGFTYKTAWRVANRVRYLFDETAKSLQDTVELDETYVGGKGGHNKRGRGAENKTPVFGMLQRKERVIAKVTADTKRKTVMPIIRENVDLTADVMTDEYLPYRSLTREGYNHQTVSHGTKEYARGNVHTNSIEGFWSQLKRGINGTYHSVSPKHLQHYVDEFSFRYNHRTATLPIFFLLIEKASQLV